MPAVVLCSHHVVGIRRAGMIAWFQRIDSKRRREALRRLVRNLHRERLPNALRGAHRRHARRPHPPLIRAARCRTVPRMAGRIELVVSDLDGTLWDVTHRVHPRTRAAIDALADRGIPLLVATARRPGGARRLLGDNGLRLPAVLIDGALVRDVAWRTVHADTFERDAALAVLDAFRAGGLEPCIGVVADDDCDARLGAQPSTHPDHLAYLTDWAVRRDLDDVVATEAVQSFVVCGAPLAVLEPVAAAVTGHTAVNVTWDAPYGAYTITVRPPGVDKWRGVVSFCEHAGIDAHRVLAVGDGLNDVELLAAASVACVVDGSDERVAAHADQVVGRPEDGGWADVLELLDEAS
jgi:HAD superfamily hydrolase (TIGR01484 family)